MDNSERAQLYKEAIKKYKDRTFQVIGAALEVHSNLGCGFMEAVSELQKIHEAQVINYLKATGFEVGLLFNFGSESLENKRFFNIYHNSI